MLFLHMLRDIFNYADELSPHIFWRSAVKDYVVGPEHFLRHRPLGSYARLGCCCGQSALAQARDLHGYWRAHADNLIPFPLPLCLIDQRHEHGDNTLAVARLLFKPAFYVASSLRMDQAI